MIEYIDFDLSFILGMIAGAIVIMIFSVSLYTQAFDIHKLRTECELTLPRTETCDIIAVPKTAN